MSKIEWTQETWNPVVGCTKCSPGCQNCYAERMAKRLKAIGVAKYQDVVDANGWTGKIAFDEDELRKPLKRKKPTLYFVDSMGDLFHENMPTTYIQKVFFFIQKCQQHHFILLTKRPEKMLEEVGRWSYGCDHGVQQNVTHMVTVCNQEEANANLPILLQVPSVCRGVSIEPMLGSADLTKIPAASWGSQFAGSEYRGISLSALDGGSKTDTPWHLNWVICGGETGPGARPMHPDWVRKVRDQCVAAGVPFFFKQWGEWSPIVEPDDDVMRAYLVKNKKGVWITPDGLCGDDTTEKWDENFSKMMVRCGKKTAGHAIDGIGWRMVPEVLKKFFGESK